MVLEKESTKNQKERSDAAAVLGRKGGEANVRRWGSEHMREIGKRGAESRWKNKK